MRCGRLRRGLRPAHRRVRRAEPEGLTSAAAKARLLAAHRALGKVSIARRYKHIKRLVVSTQSAKAHTTLAAGTKVAVSLKPPPPPRRKKKHRR